MIASGRENDMSDSVYKVIEVVGTSSKSLEAAAAAAVERASQSLRDLRVAEVTEQDVQIKDGKIELYRDEAEAVVQVRRVNLALHGAVALGPR
jgi:flavin-binding protein dodecin